MPEEEISLDIDTAVFLLMRSGLYATNGYDPSDNSFALGARAIIAPSKMVVTYIHAGMTAAEECDDELDD